MIDAIKNIIKNDKNEEKFKYKIIDQIVNEGNVNYLANHLFWNCQNVVKIFSDQHLGMKPLLYTIGFTNNMKMFGLFYDSLVYYFNNLISNENGELLMEAYLNFNHCKDIIYQNFFWGFEVSDKNSLTFKYAKKIIESKYFNGFEEMNEISVCSISLF